MIASAERVAKPTASDFTFVHVVRRLWHAPSWGRYIAPSGWTNTVPRKDKDKDSRSQLVGYVKDSYLERTSRPIYALAYLLGFLVFYEFGTILINPEALSQSLEHLQGRVVAFLWVQQLLRWVGFSGRWLWVATPSVVVIILLALQITSRTGWRVYLRDFVPMTCECVLSAVPLIVLSLLINRAPAAMAATNGLASNPVFVEIVTGIGAGVYEELIFRLVLICVLMFLLQDLLGLSKTRAIVLSVLLSAVAFSAYHHWGLQGGHLVQGEPFRWQPFVFRTVAGVYFSVLFALRGFGIAAGAHTFYDIIAALLK